MQSHIKPLFSYKKPGRRCPGSRLWHRSQSSKTPFWRRCDLPAARLSASKQLKSCLALPLQAWSSLGQSAIGYFLQTGIMTSGDSFYTRLATLSDKLNMVLLGGDFHFVDLLRPGDYNHLLAQGDLVECKPDKATFEQGAVLSHLDHFLITSPLFSASKICLNSWRNKRVTTSSKSVSVQREACRRLAFNTGPYGPVLYFQYSS